MAFEIFKNLKMQKSFLFKEMKRNYQSNLVVDTLPHKVVLIWKSFQGFILINSAARKLTWSKNVISGATLSD